MEGLKMLLSGSSKSASPLIPCCGAGDNSVVGDLLSLNVLLVKDSASSNASISWRYFGLLTASSNLSPLTPTDSGTAAADTDALSSGPSLVSSDVEQSVPNVINRGFYYCKLCLERQQDEYRSTAGRHGDLSNVQKYSVHTATTAYKSHLFNVHGIVDKTSWSSVKLETASNDDLSTNFDPHFMTSSKKLGALQSYKTVEPPAWTTEELHRDICLWFIRDMRSLEAVADRGFGEFCMKNFPHFSVPNPGSLSCNWLEQMYADVKDRLRATLYGIRAVCIMVEAWTDRHRRVPVIGLRLAYVDPVNWSFRIACLSMKVASHQTGAERAAHIRAELRDFGVADDCVVYTTDDGTEAARHCGRLLKSAHQTHCVMHGIDLLVVVDALNQVPGTMQVVRKCMTVVETLYCRLEMVADETALLHERQRLEIAKLSENIVNIKRLIECDERIFVPLDDSCDVKAASSFETESTEESICKPDDNRSSSSMDTQQTKGSGLSMCSRWCVVLSMLENLLEMAPVVQSALKKCGNRELCFDEHELSIMKVLVNFLLPLREFSEMVSSCHPHLGLLLMVRDQIDDFCRPCRRDTTDIETMKRKIRQNLERRIPIDDMVLATSILEPGTRAIVDLDQEEQIRVVVKIWNEMENEMSGEGRSALSSASPCERLSSASVDDNLPRNDSPTSPGSSCSETSVESKRKRIIRQILERRGLSIGGEETIHSEITRYLNTKATEEEERAPLLFWQNNQKNFPRLHQLARNLLSVSAGSVGVDDLFSTSGLQLNGRRANLAPHELNMMSVVHSNYSVLY